MRLPSRLLLASITAGGVAFACGGSSSGEDDVGVVLPERVPSSPEVDGSLVDSGVPIVEPPADAAVDSAEAGDASRPLRAFVSSALLTGALGGLAGADLKCNTLAAAQPALKGTYRAWISVAGTNASDRITSTGPWHLVTGEAVVPNRAALVSGALLRPLNKDEKGLVVPPSEDRVWTATAGNGTDSTPDCTAWTGAGNGRVGEASFADGRWTSSVVEPCTQVNRIYCFEL